ncbi:MAG TPA: cytochrome c oxidase assembly protein [Candidatus Limnocylindrales bacterium]|nr:cytochrome c oxidase assembly protein [Candidatus Limnocylindrales bacterium]
MTIVALLALSGALYGWGLLRIRGARRPFPRRATVAFGGALALVAAVLLGPLDDLADASLAWHMVQHLALVLLVAPLLLLGAPLRLALGALPPHGAAVLARVLNATPVRALTNPGVAWVQFVLVLYGTHFSPLYEAALENPTVHACEHALYLTSALVFWTPVLAVPPAPHAPPHAVRILMLFLALPASAFLGFAFYVGKHVLYAHYAVHPGALEDQIAGGAVMWIAGGTPLLIALLWCIADWGAREQRLAAISDEG